MTNAHRPRRLMQRCRHHYPAPPGEVFPLLCPVREVDWIPAWRCQMIWSDSGVAENNCVFMTDFPEFRGREVWVVSRYAPPEAIEFVRCAPHRVTRLEILLEPDGGGGTRAQWTHTTTSLSEEGNLQIAHLEDGRYETEMRTLERLLTHYLATGTMLTRAAAHQDPGGDDHAHHQPGGPAA